MLTLSSGGAWRCTVPEEDWSDQAEVVEAIKADFQGEWGDRRQEIVFIGQHMKAGGGELRIRRAMDGCLLTDREFRAWEKAMRSKDPEGKLGKLFEDGFEDWPDESHEHDHDHGH